MPEFTEPRTPTADELAAHNARVDAEAAPAELTDDESSRAFEAEQVALDVIVAPETIVPVDTRTADANYDSRSNIVRP